MNSRNGRTPRDTVVSGANPRAFTPPHLAERILNSRSALEGELKDVSILFADVVGSTRLIEDLDAEDAFERLQPALEAMISGVHRFEGTVTRSMGDGIMALFGAPLAHEDHAVRACMAGLAMQEAVAQLGDATLTIRVGVHSGQVIFQSISNDLAVAYEAVGEAVHLAARMEQLCEPGCVRCSGATEKLVRGFVDLRPLGPIAVKGLSRPIEIYEIHWLPAPRTRWQVRASQRLTKFVGRTEEVRSLVRSLDHTRRSSGQVVAVVGDAGVGKSRLVHEFLSSIRGSDVLVVEAAALPEIRTTPYLATTQLLRAWLGIVGEDVTQASNRLRERLEAVAPQLATFSSAYCELLHIPITDETWIRRDPDDRRNFIQRAMRALFVRLSQARPVVMVFEDLHWLDDETLSMLDVIVDSLGTARILLIVTYRLDHKERWKSKPYFARHRLYPFDAEQTSAFLDACLGTAPDLNSLRRRIAERAEGTPLFIEELVRHLTETAVLTGTYGHYRTTHDVDDIAIPQTVQNVIAARVDRLPPDSKDALHVASVIGSAVTAPLLADAAGVDDDALVRAVAALRENGFLFEARTGFETEYIFKHALIRDVALASIPRRRRKNLHRVIASSIESRYLRRLEPYLDQLAYHTRNAEMWEQAVSYAERAANRALDLSAYGLCVQHLDNALSSLERLPESSNRLEQAIDLRLALRAPLGAVGDIARMQARLDEAGNLLRRLNDENRAAAISISKTFAYNYTGELAKAKDAGVAALQLARSAANNEFIVAATYHLAQSYVWSGDYTEASELLAGVLGLATGPLRESRIGTAGTTSVLILGLLGAAEAYVGRFNDADKHIDEAIAIADQVSRPYDQTIARWYKGFALAQSGAHQKAIGLLEDAYHRCKESEIAFLNPVVATSLGLSYASAGRYEEADAILGNALEQHQRTGLKYGIAYASLNLASVAFQKGNAKRTAKLLAQAIELATTYGFAGVQVAALRLRAMASGLSRAAGYDSKCDAAQALALAEKKNMGPDIGHSYLALARICRKVGDRDVAKRHTQQALSLYHKMGMTEWFERASKLL